MEAELQTQRQAKQLPARPESITRTYRFVMAVCRPVAWWGRMQVEGAELLPRSGPLLVIGNHDSRWDPVLIGIAAIKRRQIRALAKASLWKNRLLARVLNGMRQIPILRGAGDAGALANAVTALNEDGGCVGIFPEGTISRGTQLRPRSGVGRLALDAPDAEITLVRVTGATDLARFPTRPRIRIRFFRPSGGAVQAGDDPVELAARWVGEIRAEAPPIAAGRKGPAAPKPD